VQVEEEQGELKKETEKSDVTLFRLGKKGEGTGENSGKTSLSLKEGGEMVDIYLGAEEGKSTMLAREGQRQVLT